MSNQVAGNLRKNNETLVKNINRMGDISIQRFYLRPVADSCSQTPQLHQNQNAQEQVGDVWYFGFPSPSAHVRAVQLHGWEWEQWK